MEEENNNNNQEGGGDETKCLIKPGPYLLSTHLVNFQISLKKMGRKMIKRSCHWFNYPSIKKSIQIKADFLSLLVVIKFERRKDMDILEKFRKFSDHVLAIE
ncbi:hypothetical protein Glove_232g63 [Diversispora epigaea]|uniref:Uncharacterized protein n=1 Tax=Diversispora epigaea TaxID=1348612 RepID=A0A397IKM7_9GLOM|nr:hypothetical protein Glove_232g63 [Diversispora epigaea]